MNQRIQVRSIIKKDGKILLLKRTPAIESAQAFFSLPGGKVGDREQPEDTVSRYIKQATGLDTQVSYLSDVFTYVDERKPDIQYAVIVYTTSISGGTSDIRLGSGYSRYIWKSLSGIVESELTDLSSLLLKAHQSKPRITTTFDGVSSQTTVNFDEKRRDSVVIYSDGGSRGNPGPSAAGYVIKDVAGKLSYEGGAYLGITTNNQAEYHGVRLGLEKAKELGVKYVEFYIDSMLVVNQLNGSYVIRNRELWPIHERIKELVAGFDKVMFRHIKREFNQQADGMVNKILDAKQRKEADL